MRRWAGLVAAILMVVVCAGCGGGTTAVTTASGGTQTGATPGSDEIQKDPGAILSDSAGSMQNLQSYHVEFKGSYFLGSMSWSMDVDPNQQATGSMTLNGTFSEFVITGTTMYIQERALAQILMGQPIDPSYDGKWIGIPTSYGLNLDTWRTATLMASCINDYDSNLQARPQTTIDRQKAVPLLFVDSSQDRGIFYVALDSTAHLIHWTIQASPEPPADCTGGVNHFNDQGTYPGPVGDFTFSNFNKPVNVLVPTTGTQGPTPAPTPTV